MKKMLLAAAGSVAAIALSGGAQAQEWSGHHHSRPFVGVPEGSSGARGFHRNCSGDLCRFDGRGFDGGYIDWYDSDWARNNNRSWEATSYNDWWHEDPARAYPAWTRHNQDCARKWYAGDTLTC